MVENGPAWEPISFDPTHRIVPARAEVHGGRGIGQVFPPPPPPCLMLCFLPAVASWTISRPQRPLRHTTAMHPQDSSADKPIDVARKSDQHPNLGSPTLEPTLLIKWDDSMMDKVTAMTKRYDELNEEVGRPKT